MLPYRDAQRVRRLAPLHRLDQPGVGGVEDSAQLREPLAAPVAELPDLALDELGGVTVLVLSLRSSSSA